RARAIMICQWSFRYQFIAERVCSRTNGECQSLLFVPRPIKSARMPNRPRKHSLSYAVGEAGGLVMLMVLIKVVEALFQISFAGFGIIPRNYHGLIGIFTAPLLHGSFAHLFANIG